jgi:hypothetical protein
MTATAPAVSPSGQPDGVAQQIERAGSCEIAVLLPTYNNADTVKALATAVAHGLEKDFAGVRAVLINTDAGSADGTPALLADVPVPVVAIPYDAPATERLAVPYHGVPGRGAALHAAFAAARRLGTRALVALEADLTTLTEDWVSRLAGPVLDGTADLVSPVYPRHRYDGSIVTLLVSPLLRALFGRRLQRPLTGQMALSARLLDHLLAQPTAAWTGRDLADVWVIGVAVAGGFGLRETWLGPRAIRSRTRTHDLPAMVAQTLGAVFTVMDRWPELWLETRGSERVPAVGEPSLPSTAPIAVDVDRMVEAFRLGVRDLTSIWEYILAPETLSDVLGLQPGPGGRVTFPDDLWARVVYDFALGHHYNVVHRDHLLRSLVPLYLGRTAAFVLASERLGADATAAAADAIGAAFERQKPYLVERWR